MFFRSTRCSLNRDRQGNEQQHTPIQEDDAEETETLKRMSGTFFNQWRLRRDRQEYSDDDDGSTSSSGASLSENEEDDISVHRPPPPQVLVPRDASECGETLSPWGNKCKAKQNIWRELDDKESSIHLMTVEQIHQKWASKYPLTRFKVNFEAMKTQKRVYYQDDDVEPWKTQSTTSKSHDLLFKLFMDRDKTKVHMMTAEQLLDSHDCFKPYSVENFRVYVKDVEKRTRELRSVIDKEEQAHRAFCTKYPRNELTNKGVPFWDVHPAKQLLEKDVKDGVAAELKPKKLWSTRPEYKEFTLKIFTEHYYQETRKQLAAPYWQYKRNKYALKEHQEEVGSMRNEWHENMYGKVQDMFSGMNLTEREGISNEVDVEETSQEVFDKTVLMDMNIDQLKDILRSKGLAVSGRKAELVERISFVIGQIIS
jgi:hypothetical protein